MTLMFAEFSVSVPASAQRVSPRSTALDQADSRAEQEAEQMVALSADKILTILRQEPGLLLQVKKILVRKAYEQGRLLDPVDLTDDAVFQLLREDQNIRVLATQEIENRNYIRAKPSRQELARGEVRNAQGTLDSQGKPAVSPDENLTHNQENAYWAQHEYSAQPNYGRPNYGQGSVPVEQQQPGMNAPQQQQQPYIPAPQMPQSIPADSARTLDRADAQFPDRDYYEGAPQDAANMPSIQPEELPGLLNTSANTNESARAFSGGTRAGNPQGLSPSTQFPNPSALNSGSDAQSRQPDWSSWQQASLTNGRNQEMPFFSPRSLIQQPRLMHRPNPYADVPSLYDLYSQYSRSPVPQRFGQEIFRTGTGNFEKLPMDLPAGPDYVVGPGDGLSIELWGGVSERLQRTVDREGRLALPEAGAVQVSGRTLGDVQHLVQSVLRNQYRDVEADVSLARIRTVRVYVTGDVLRPGAYDVSSLSTPLNAVFLAGGPTSQGSLRTILQKRGGNLVQQVDVYDLLLHGVRSDLQGLQPGDTVFVPPLSDEVTVEGMVRRPAIYELNGEKSLAQVLELAGGVLPSGTLRHVDVERVQAHESRSMLRLDIPENNNEQAVNKALADFTVQDGDKIKISPIVPYADKTVYLDGHVFHPGKYAYSDGMKVTDLIKSYKDLLPEPSKVHAEIIRLNAPDYTPTVLTFNLGEALEGKAQDVALKPFDTVRVFGRFDFEDPPVVTVSGEVRDPGDHITNGATHLRDAVYLAGGATSDALLDDAQVFRKTDDGKLKVLDVSLKNALAGDAKDNILLEPKDRILIHRDLNKLDPAAVIIQGEVARPGKYPLGDEMTAAELVRVAGGFKRGAYTETADLTRYLVENGKKVVGDHSTVRIADAMAGQPDTDVRLHDGDVLSIGTLAGWNDVGATITLKGEVVHPGTYGIREGERLSSVLERAGGLLPDAYPYGAIFQRAQVLQLEEKNRNQMVRDIQDQGASLQQVPENDAEQKVSKEAALQQWQQALEEIQNTPPAGRMVVHISSKMKRWVNTSSDVQVRAGDSLYVPKRPGTVMVDGSVFNPTAITYKSGKNTGWYLRQAGGPTSMANKKAVFVIRADGSVVGGSGGLFSGGVETAALQPGDMVVVPEKAFSSNTRWKTTLEGAQLAYAVGIAIQVAKSF
ncbi:MAG TPA: SLBB domain-containing protein [Terriglobales bacterium]|jgi:protein involved in polysaccharide export with SLBB domain